jgi:hypothetical protein
MTHQNLEKVSRGIWFLEFFGEKAYVYPVVFEDFLMLENCRQKMLKGDQLRFLVLNYQIIPLEGIDWEETLHDGRNHLIITSVSEDFNPNVLPEFVSIPIPLVLILGHHFFFNFLLLFLSISEHEIEIFELNIIFFLLE